MERQSLILLLKHLPRVLTNVYRKIECVEMVSAAHINEVMLGKVGLDFWLTDIRMCTNVRSTKSCGLANSVKEKSSLMGYH